MVSVDHILPYCWDARPYPAFPTALDVWGDGANWALGHWLNGRLAGGALDKTLAALLEDYGFDRGSIAAMPGTVQGYMIDRVMSAREALQPLELAYFFDVVESDGRVTFRPRGQGAPIALVAAGDLVEAKAGSPLMTVTRGQETDLPASAKISYIDGDRDYQPAVAEARRLAGSSGRVAQAEMPIVMDAPDGATAVGDVALRKLVDARTVCADAATEPLGGRGGRCSDADGGRTVAADPSDGNRRSRRA